MTAIAVFALKYSIAGIQDVSKESCRGFYGIGCVIPYCSLGSRRGRWPAGFRLWELLGQETQQWPIDSEEETDFHRIAEEVLDEAAQEDGRSGLVVENGQPERVEAQVDEDHDEEKRDAGAPQRDALAIEEPAVDIACEKAGDEKAREEDTRAKQCRADEVSGCCDEASLHGPVHCTIDGNRQKAERDAHEDRLDGKDIGEEDSQGHGDTGINERLDGEFRHEKKTFLSIVVRVPSRTNVSQRCCNKECL